MEKKKSMIVKSLDGFATALGRWFQKFPLSHPDTYSSQHNIKYLLFATDSPSHKPSKDY
jgi:hypothetical protein